MKQRYIVRSLISMGVILASMPVVHLIAGVLKRNYTGEELLGAGMLLGLVGYIMVVVGVVIKNDTRQTLLGLVGGIFFWTGWVDFLFMYYAQRWGAHSELDAMTGHVTRPEYLLLPATFGLWVMIMLLYVFSTRNGCNFLNWWQTLFFRDNKRKIAARTMTRHTAIITFMEINTMLWTCYLLLMFCYDSHFIGRLSPITFGVGLACFIGSVFVFMKQLRLRSWGANIRMAIATVIVFWIGFESFHRTEVLTFLFRNPEAYPWHWVVLAVEVLALAVYLLRRRGAKAKA